MKKAIGLLVLTVMVLTLGMAASGCAGTVGSDSDATGSYANAIPGGSTEVSAEVLDALTMETEISMYFFDTKIGEWYEEFVKYYEEVYNGKVNYIFREWSLWHEDYLTKFAAGDAADLIYLYELNFPTFTNRSMVYSNKELTEMGVVGLDHPLIAKDRDVADRHFTYKGESYSFTLNTAEADMIFVNEDLFKKYSVKSPSEYYAEGIWNWETFEKCATELTRDTNGDGASDIWGYYGWDGNFVINAAGGELVHLNEDGTVSTALDNAAGLQGLQNYINLQTNLKCYPKSDPDFAAGNLGMIAWMPQNEYDRITGTGKYEGDPYTFNWSMIPYPLDERTNSAGIRSGKAQGWCVSTSADATTAQGCVNYMIALNAFETIKPNPDKADYTKAFSEEQLQMINDCNLQAQLPIFQGVGNLWHAQWEFWGALQRGGAAPSEIVQTYKPLFDAQCAIENAMAK